MLTYKINNKDMYLVNKVMKVEGIGYTNTEVQTITFEKDYLLENGETITFARTNKDGSIIYFSKDIEIKGSNGRVIDIKNVFKNYLLYPTGFNISEFRDERGVLKKLLTLEFNGESHDIMRGCDDLKVKGRVEYDSDGKQEIVDETCDGNTYISGGVLLLTKNSNGSYERINWAQNVKAVYNGEEVYTMQNCFTPYKINSNGDIVDDRNRLCWVYDSLRELYMSIFNTYDDSKPENEIFREVFNNITFLVEDLRFFSNSELRKNVIVYKIDGNIKIPVFITEKFEGNMNQSDYINNILIPNRVNENINKIVDMEKQIFNPICDNIEPLTMEFILCLRERKDENNNYIEGWKNNATKEEWSFGAETSGETNYNTIVNYTGDKLGYLGFEDNDVYYRKNNVKKSFIRLSFYDSKSRANQSLLYYSTIFFDENKLYANYVNDCNTIKDNVVTNADSTVNAVLSTHSKYDFSNSSEGFYLYLFPSLCKNGEATIYMKVEFNHAKFGYTIPLALYKNEENDFKYQSGKVLTDVLNDLYTEVKIKYDNVNNRFTWEVPYTKNIDNSKLQLFLIEPILMKPNQE